MSIRRVKDVDVFCRLTTAPEMLAPGEAMTKFERVLDAEYGDLRTRQHRSFKIDVDDDALSVDVVPAKPAGDHWKLRPRPLGWTCEGVETVEQLAWLASHGCPQVQGDLLSRPVPPEQLPDAYDASRGWRASSKAGRPSHFGPSCPDLL